MNYCMQQSMRGGVTECCLFQRNTSKTKNIFGTFEENCGIIRNPSNSSSKMKDMKIQKPRSKNGENSSLKKKISITKTNERSRSIQNTTKPFGSFEQAQKNFKNPKTTKLNEDKNQKLSFDNDQKLEGKTHQIKFMKSEQKSQLQTSANQFHNYYSAIKANKYYEQSLKACLNCEENIHYSPIGQETVSPPLSETIKQSGKVEKNPFHSINMKTSQQQKWNEKRSFTASKHSRKGASLQEVRKNTNPQSLDKMNEKSVKSVYENSEFGTKKIEESIILFNFFNPTEFQRKNIEVDIKRLKVYFSSHLS